MFPACSPEKQASDPTSHASHPSPSLTRLVWAVRLSRPRCLSGEAMVLSAAARAPREGLASAFEVGTSALPSRAVAEAAWCQHLDPSGRHSSSPSCC